MSTCTSSPGWRRSPSQLPKDLVEAIEALRRLWMTAAEIAEILGLLHPLVPSQSPRRRKGAVISEQNIEIVR
jgi:hypothetical protein